MSKISLLVFVLALIGYYFPGEWKKKILQLVLGERVKTKKIAPATEPTPPLAMEEGEHKGGLPPLASLTKETLTRALEGIVKGDKYTSERERNLILTKSLLPLPGWEFRDEKHSVRISALALPGFELPFIRGDANIPGQWTLEEVLSVVQNYECRKNWDPRFDTTVKLVILNGNEFVVHSVQKGTFPVAARDLFLYAGTIFEDSKVYSVSNSIQDTDHLGPPEGNNGRVRGHLLVGSWVLEKRQGSVAASYIVHIDPKGSVPTSLMKMVQVQTPLCIHGVSNFLNEKSFFPFMIRGTKEFAPTSDVMFQSLDLNDQITLVEYSISSKESIKPKCGRVTIAFPKKYYNGVSVELDCSLDSAEYFSRIVPLTLLNGIVSDATSFVLEFWVSPESLDLTGSTIVKMTIKAVPISQPGVYINDDRIDSSK